MCLPAVALLWGYMVDDALISARVADHLKRGLGYRFNSSGPLVDAVTPLGYAHLLALLGGGDVLSIWNRARAAGAAAWLLAAFLLGMLVYRRGGSRLRWVPMGVLATCVPPAAWAVSGMETAPVTLLMTLALFVGRGGALAAGLAAAWRPELLPFCVCVAVGAVLVDRRGAGAKERALSVLAILMIVVSPAAVVACLRYAYFGSVSPLAVYAKPSDLAHGLRYALGGSLLLGLPSLLLAPRALRRVEPRDYVLLTALVVHFLVLVAAGGDWMALYRLWVPVIPALVAVSASVQARSTPVPISARALVACALCLTVGLSLGPRARQVGEHRIELIQAARPFLRGRRVASLDVGWVGAATDASVVDLAGVTDPRVARMPGGHTSKRIPPAFLDTQRVQTLVLLLQPSARLATPWQKSRFARQVETQVANVYGPGEGEVVAALELGGTAQKYLIVQVQP